MLGIFINKLIHMYIEATLSVIILYNYQTEYSDYIFMKPTRRYESGTTTFARIDWNGYTVSHPSHIGVR